MRKIAIGCGGLLGVLVLLAIVGALIGGGTDTQPSSRVEGQAQGESKEEPKEEDANIGDTVTVGDTAWTVTNARRASELNSQFLEPKQGNYVVVDFTFLNNSSESITLSQNSISLVDDQGRTSDPDTDTTGYIDPNKSILLEQVNPGVNRQGEVIFSVAPNASGFRMEVGDANPFSNKSAYVDLGF